MSNSLGSNTSLIAQLKANKSIIALSAGAAATLAAASLAVINTTEGTAYANSGTCTSFMAADADDPHIFTYVDGTSANNETGSTYIDGNLNNVITYKNTVGGSTTVSTVTQENSATNYSNSSVTMTGPGFTITAAAKANGTMVYTVTDASGTHKMSNIGATRTEPNGTVLSINSNFGGQMAVTQNLNSGGTVVSILYDDPSAKYLPVDFSMSSNGALIADGTEVAQALGTTNTNSDALFTPCGAPTIQNLTGNVTNVSGGNPTAANGSYSTTGTPTYATPPQPTPVPTPVPTPIPTPVPPAWQTNPGNSAAENS